MAGGSVAGTSPDDGLSYVRATTHGSPLSEAKVSSEARAAAVVHPPKKKKNGKEKRFFLKIDVVGPNFKRWKFGIEKEGKKSEEAIWRRASPRQPGKIDVFQIYSK